MRRQENSSFASWKHRLLHRGLQMCCFVWWGFFVFVRGEKKQNKFLSNCTALSTKYQSNQSVFEIFKLASFVISYRFKTLAYDVRVYDPLRCRSALLSNYHKATKRTDHRKPSTSNGLYTLLWDVHYLVVINQLFLVLID